MALTIYGIGGVKKLSGSEPDMAVAEVLDWKLVTAPAAKSDYYATEQSYYVTADGSTIVENTWEPTKRPRQFMKLMLDYRIGVLFNKPRNRWKAIGYVDQSSENTDTPAIFAYGITPAEALCRCLILVKEAGGKAYFEKSEKACNKLKNNLI